MAIGGVFKGGTGAGGTVQIDVFPAQKVAHFWESLKNGSSKDMVVNGSGTPVQFTAGPGAGEKWGVRAVQLVVQDNGTSVYNDFGKLSKLTNGIRVFQEVNSTEYLLNNLQENNDIVRSFSEWQHYQGNGNDFVTDRNYFSGMAHFDPVVTLLGDNSDHIGAEVRDALAGLNFLEMAVYYFKIV